MDELEHARTLAVVLEQQLATAEEVCRAADAYLKASSTESLANLGFAVMSWHLAK